MEKRSKQRVITNLLMKECDTFDKVARASFSDAIRVMRPFLIHEEDSKSELDNLEFMLSRKNESLNLPDSVMTVLEAIDVKLKFNMRYMSYIAAQRMGLMELPCDIGSGGISFPTFERKGVGDTVLIQALLPVDPPFIFSVPVHISWCRPCSTAGGFAFRVGGKFEFRNACEKEVVARFIKHFSD